MKCNKVLASVASLMLVLSPLNVYADDTVYATDNNGNNYTSIESAWSAANSGTAITLLTDWNLEDRLVLNENVTAVVELNGHKISRNLTQGKSDGEVFYLSDCSNLTLNGLNAPQTEFTFTGCYFYDSTKEVTYTSGGLITGGYSTNSGGGIHVKKGATLNLNHVIVGGNHAKAGLFSNGEGGAICMDGDDTYLKMDSSYIVYNNARVNGGGIYSDSENSTIEVTNSYIDNNTASHSSGSTNHGGAIYINQNDTLLKLTNSEIKSNNVWGDGGGVYVNDEDVSITLDNSHINENGFSDLGGGICVNDSDCSIEMSNNSSINKNNGGNKGAGIYFNYTDFSVKGTDSTLNTISENTSKSGGTGIYVCSNTLTFSNSGEISGLTIDSNYSNGYDGDSIDDKMYACGGGMFIAQENVLVSNCIITNNTATRGGGVFVDNDDVTFENVVVTNNNSWDKYGGFFVSNESDVILNGKVIIKDNTTKSKDKLNLHLDSEILTAYVKGNLSEGSQVGVYVDEARTIAKKQPVETMKYFFLDTTGYLLEYSSKDQTLSSVVNSTGSIFGDGNTLIAGCVMLAVVAVGVVCLVVHKKKEAK